MENVQNIKVEIGILKPADEVFDAIVNPEKMTNYFISSSTGSMTPGAELIWRFPEFDEDAPVHVKEVISNKQINYVWDDYSGKPLLVTIKLISIDPGTTVVRITEGAVDGSFVGIKWLTGNTYGWANFLACLKAYLEYGINLRKGAFGYQTAHL